MFDFVNFERLKRDFNFFLTTLNVIMVQSFRCFKFRPQLCFVLYSSFFRYLSASSFNFRLYNMKYIQMTQKEPFFFIMFVIQNFVYQSIISV